MGCGLHPCMRQHCPALPELKTGELGISCKCISQHAAGACMCLCHFMPPPGCRLLTLAESVPADSNLLLFWDISLQFFG